MKTVSNLLSAYLTNSPNSCHELLKQCHNIGASLNDSGHRFMKAKLIDKKYSKVFPYLEYVDEVGYDWTFCKQRVSGKSQQKMFQKRTGKTNAITIANKLGKNYTMEKMFDYIILTQTSAPYSIAVGSYENIYQYFEHSGDKITASIPHEKLDFIVNPSEGIDFPEEATYDYGRLMDTILDRMLERNLMQDDQVVLSI
jgi:hypothetical protein